MSKYEPCECGEHCVMYGERPEEPCWGDVNVVEEALIYNEEGTEIIDSYYIHACDGHKREGKYKPEPKEKSNE